MERMVTLENVEISDLHGHPELITSLLYKRLLQKLEEAIACISEKKYAQANAALQLCNDIVTRLGFGIKYEAGVLADRLEMLYQYVFERIIQGNLRKDIKLLQEAKEIICQLDEAWTIAMEKEKGKTQVMAHLAGKPRLNPYERREIEQETWNHAEKKQFDF
ncbi:flagellar protein FliS [Aneurinibacillus thermoaerophilus]|uniref:flagellar export chaperone FliS n=1 Tax=Aneurinibacillus thermoaerophilus TaxID=143495 RepID=UPI002E1EAA05|nr:flagellar protein FliS [Aneurinibacillus thermoaerophilus]MED0765281.1 flagellar protein FliS [Aneurinibacillus thermoaerophilus]